jgi:hypothetical protein
VQLCLSALGHVATCRGVPGRERGPGSCFRDDTVKRDLFSKSSGGGSHERECVIGQPVRGSIKMIHVSAYAPTSANDSQAVTTPLSAVQLEATDSL